MLTVSQSSATGEPRTPAAPPPAVGGVRNLNVALVLSTALVIGVLAWIMFVTPADTNLGIVQKIFYFHVGTAFGMLLCLVGASACAAIDLMSPSEPVDAAGRALTELGLVCALAVLTSGPLWARKSWGTWWTWEPRLTLTLLVSLVALAVMILRDIAGESAQGRKIANSLAVLAAPMAYLIHIAVQKWGGTHPQVLQGGGISSSDMRIAFWGSVVAVLSMCFSLAALRYRTLRTQSRIQQLRLELSVREMPRNRQEAA